MSQRDSIGFLKKRYSHDPARHLGRFCAFVVRSTANRLTCLESRLTLYSNSIHLFTSPQADAIGVDRHEVCQETTAAGADGGTTSAAVEPENAHEIGSRAE